MLDVEFKEEDFEIAKINGIYKVIITNLSTKDTRSGGKGLVVDMQIATGNNKGTFVSDFINYVNTNPQAEKIGRRKIDSLAKALGLSGGIEFSKTPFSKIENKVIEVDVETVEDDYGTKYRAKKYLAPRKEGGDEKLDDAIPF